MIKYLGSKRTLLPLITSVVGALRPSGTVIDLFSGTSRVGHALKRLGYRVRANDHTAYAATLAVARVSVTVELRGPGDAGLRSIVGEGFPRLVEALSAHGRSLARHVAR